MNNIIVFGIILFPQNHLSVPATPFQRQMQETFFLINNSLVKLKTRVEKNLKQKFRTIRTITIRSFTFNVLARQNTANNAVKLFATITACDMNRLPKLITQRLQKIFTKIFEVSQTFFIRAIVNCIFNSSL